MKVIKMKRQVEMVTFEVKPNEVQLLANVMEEAVNYFKSSFYQERPMALAAYFMGLEPMAEKKYQENPHGSFSISISADAFRLMLRAIRTKLAKCASPFDCMLWGKLFYDIRDQVDKSVWKRCEKLSYGNK